MPFVLFLLYEFPQKAIKKACVQQRQFTERWYFSILFQGGKRLILFVA